MEVEINGVKYKAKTPHQTTPKKPSKSIMMLYGMAMMFSGQGSVGGSRPANKTMSPYEIVKEYELIQQKKSNLSRRERNYIIYQFEKTFEEVLKT